MAKNHLEALSGLGPSIWGPRGLPQDRERETGDKETRTHRKKGDKERKERRREGQKERELDT